MIPFLNLQKINNLHHEEIMSSIERVVRSGQYILGKEVYDFEKQLSQYIGIKHAIGTSNGLDSLTLIFKGLIEIGLLKKGDEVLVPANTFIASILAITHNGLKPVWVEPEISHHNINPWDAQKKTTPKTKAILLVHLYGRICWSEDLADWVEMQNLIVIEDNAQAIGASFNGTKSGAIGLAAAFSFYPGKNLGALGDAGAITTSNDALAEVILALRNYGSKEKYVNLYQGYNNRMDPIQAAVLSVKLKHLDAENDRRRSIATYYLQNIEHSDIILPTKPDRQEHCVWHLFVVRTQKRSKLMNYLSMKGIETLIHYPIPAHLQIAFKEYNNLHLPITETLKNEILSLPISPVHLQEEISYITETINQF